MSLCAASNFSLTTSSSVQVQTILTFETSNIDIAVTARSAVPTENYHPVHSTILLHFGCEKSSAFIC